MRRRFSDFDGDGDMDMFVGVLGGAFNPNYTSADNLYYFERDADGLFNLTSKRFLYNLDVGRESIPTFVDLDGDGDLDFILSNKIEQDNFDIGRSIYFEIAVRLLSPRINSRIHSPSSRPIITRPPSAISMPMAIWTHSSAPGVRGSACTATPALPANQT